MVARVHKSHPHLKEPILFVEWLSTSQLTRQQIASIFKIKGQDEPLFLRYSQRNSRYEELGWRARVEFRSIDDAEKALACFQIARSTESGSPDLPYLLKTYTESGHKPAVPPRPDPSVSPRQVQGLSSTSTLFDVYNLLRPYGPIHSIFIDEILGTCVEFYSEENACAAGRELKQNENVTLQAYNPCTLFCDPLPVDMTSDGLQELFEKFGNITSSRIVRKNGKSRVLGFVSFTSPEEARQALNAMNDHQVGNNKLRVEIAYANRKGPTASTKTGTSRAQTDNPTSEAGKRSSDTNLPSKESTRNPPPTASATPKSGAGETNTKTVLGRMANAKFFDLWARTRKSEADRLKVEITELRTENNQLRLQLEECDTRTSKIQSKLDRVSKTMEAKSKLLCETEISLRRTEERLKSEVQQLELENKDLEFRLDNTETKSGDLEDEVADLTRRLQTSMSRIKVLEMDLERRKEEDELRDKKEKEEARRKEIEEVRRRMEEMNRAERERAKKAEEQEQARIRKEKEERKAREKAEGEKAEGEKAEGEKAEGEKAEGEKAEGEKAEGEEAEGEKAEGEKAEGEEAVGEEAEGEKAEGEEAEGEKRERELKEKEREEKERKEKAEKLQRQQAWKMATEAELNRCRQRDTKLCGISRVSFQIYGPGVSVWNVSKALARFESMIKEFESIKFSVDQPLTFENIPWPALAHPYKFKIEDVAWDTVEAFFDSIQKLMVFAQYKALVEKAHRLFHPDRWQSRNLLSTVMDEQFRKTLEVAGNTVSQAITPLWRRSR